MGVKKDHLLGKTVVIDTDSRFVYIGRLSSINDSHYELCDADVHDITQTTTTYDQYIVKTKQTGIIENRRRVYIAKNKVVSLSELDEVVD